MKKTIAILIILNSINIFSQTLKTYDGNYKNGHAKYTYYENEQLERIFNGDFEFKYSSSLGLSTILGHYNKNQKVGEWVYYYNSRGESIKINGSYSKNAKFGTWKVVQASDNNNQTYLSTLVFNENDTITGKIEFPKLNGQFDKSGKFTGNWHITDGNSEFLAEFSNNILTKLINRQIDDGKIISKYTLLLDSIRLNPKKFIKASYSLKSGATKDLATLFNINDGSINSIGLFFNLIYENLNTYNRIFNFLDINIVVKDPELIYTRVQKTEDLVKVAGIEVLENDSNIYNTAGIDVKPEFPGGMEKFFKFIGQNFKVPNEEGLKGKVFVTFIIEKDGSLSDIKVLRGIGYGTGKEAIRVLSISPKWSPGEMNGKKIRVLYALPISIQSAD